MDNLVFLAGNDLLFSEESSEIKEAMSYNHYTSPYPGKGFEGFLKLGIAHFINNNSTLEEDIKNANSLILNEYPKIAKKVVEKKKRDLNLKVQLSLKEI